MADYSIDDILAELDAKKAGNSEQPDAPIIPDMSYTDVLNDISASESDTEDSSYAVDKVLADTETFAISDGEGEYIPTEEPEEPEKPEPKEEKKEPPKQVEKPKPVHVLTHTEELKKQQEEEEKRALLLQRERENTDPDAMLDQVNPIEVKERVFSEKNEPEPFLTEDVSHMFSGNTQDIKKEQIKKLPPVRSEVGEKLEESEEVKEYVTKAPNTSLIEKLNRSMEEKRRADLKAHRTITLSDIKHKPSTVAHPLNIDYKKQIIEATGALPHENPAVEEERLAELGAEKKHKLKDFVLEDENALPPQEEEKEPQEEFDDYDSTGQIWADLCASHKGLKVRMTLLIVITALTVIVAFLNDFELFGKLGLTMFNFINRGADVESLVYVYLVLGVLGYAVCSTAISNGIIKLFTGKPDCDSVCAFSAVLSLIGGVVALVDMQSFRLGHMFIYVSVSLVGLVFNTAGKMYMISRAKRNFRFISGDSQKYYAQKVENEASASMLAKGLGNRVPVLAVMRKTEFLTDFLKSSYCDDAADRLSGKLIIGSLISGVLAGLLAYFNLFGTEFEVTVRNENPLFWAISTAIAAVTLMSPFALMLMVNRPLDKTSKQLQKSNAALLGYEAAEKFSSVNTVMTDAKTLFPVGSAIIRSVKCCQKKKSVATVNIDEAIVMAASLAIHTDGILSYAFYDVTLGDKELLKKVDGCIYEDNCGVTGWIGTRRVMFGGRALMTMHHIDLPSTKSERKHCAAESDEVVYLAVGGEVVAMFIICMTANPEVKSSLQALQKENIAVIVHTTDSIVTVEKLADMFEISPELIKILPHSAHEEYDECTKYTSRGSGGLSCGGTFTSLAKGILTAKSLMRVFSLSGVLMLSCAALGVLLLLLLTAFKQMFLLTPTVLTIYNIAAAAVVVIAQKTKKY